MKSRRFSNYSEFIFRLGCYVALMRPSKVETRLQLQNESAKVQRLSGRLATYRLGQKGFHGVELLFY